MVHCMDNDLPRMRCVNAKITVEEHTLTRATRASTGAARSAGQVHGALMDPRYASAVYNDVNGLRKSMMCWPVYGKSSRIESTLHFILPSHHRRTGHATSLQFAAAQMCLVAMRLRKAYADLSYCNIVVSLQHSYTPRSSDSR